MRVLGDRLHVAADRHPAAVDVVALEPRPSVVLATLARRGSKVDLLPRVLAHVADVEVAGQRVETDSPGVAKPVGPDLSERTRAYVGIGRRHRIGPGAEDRDAQDLAEQSGQALAVALRRMAGPDVAARAAVPHADVQEPVWSEHDQAAVVVGLRLVDRQQRLAGGAVGDV